MQIIYNCGIIHYLYLAEVLRIYSISTRTLESNLRPRQWKHLYTYMNNKVGGTLKALWEQMQY